MIRCATTNLPKEAYPKLRELACRDDVHATGVGPPTENPGSGTQDVSVADHRAKGCYLRCVNGVRQMHAKYLSSVTAFLLSSQTSFIDSVTMAKYRKLWMLESELGQLLAEESTRSLGELYTELGMFAPKIKETYLEYLSLATPASVCLMNSFNESKSNGDSRGCGYNPHFVITELYRPAVWILALLEAVEWSKSSVETDPDLQPCNRSLRELADSLSSLDYRLYIRQRAVLLSVSNVGSSCDSTMGSGKPSSDNTCGPISPRLPGSPGTTLASEGCKFSKGGGKLQRCATSKVSASPAVTNLRLVSLVYTLEDQYGILIHSDESLYEVREGMLKLLYMKTVSALVSLMGLSSQKPAYVTHLYLFRDALVLYRKKSKNFPGKSGKSKRTLTLFLDPGRSTADHKIGTGSLVVVDYVNTNSSGSLFYLIYLDTSKTCHTVTLSALSRAACVNCVNCIRSQFLRFSQYLPGKSPPAPSSPVTPISHATSSTNSTGLSALNGVIPRKYTESNSDINSFPGNPMEPCSPVLKYSPPYPLET